MKIKKNEELIQSFTLFDDIFMSKVFESDKKATEYILNVILGRNDLKVIRVKGQYSMKNPLFHGRDVVLDIYAIDCDKKVYNIEVQRNRDGAHPARARFNSAMIDTRMLKAGENFRQIAESYVIVVTEEDYFRDGEPIYVFDRICFKKQRMLGDGSHIIYVNGAYRGKDRIGILMHDFHEKDPQRIQNDLIRKRVSYFKADEKGRYEMSSLYAQVVNEYEAKIKQSEKERQEDKRKLQQSEQKRRKEMAATKIQTVIMMALSYGANKTMVISDLVSKCGLNVKQAEAAYRKYAGE